MYMIEPSPALKDMLSLRLDRSLIDHIVRATTEVADFALGRCPKLDHSHTRTDTRSMLKCFEFTQFVVTVIARSQIKVTEVLVTLVYIYRAKPHLSISLDKWARERLFLGALIVASKYLNDCSPRNDVWSQCSQFSPRDVGRVEREFLDVLDWNLSVHEPDIVAHHDLLCAPSHHYYQQQYRCREGDIGRAAFEIPRFTELPHTPRCGVTDDSESEPEFPPTPCSQIDYSAQVHSDSEFPVFEVREEARSNVEKSQRRRRNAVSSTILRPIRFHWRFGGGKVPHV